MNQQVPTRLYCACVVNKSLINANVINAFLRYYWQPAPRHCDWIYAVKTHSAAPLYKRPVRELPNKWETDVPRQILQPQFSEHGIKIRSKSSHFEIHKRLCLITHKLFRLLVGAFKCSDSYVDKQRTYLSLWERFTRPSVTSQRLDLDLITNKSKHCISS